MIMKLLVLVSILAIFGGAGENFLLILYYRYVPVLYMAVYGCIWLYMALTSLFMCLLYAISPDMGLMGMVQGVGIRPMFPYNNMALYVHIPRYPLFAIFSLYNCTSRSTHVLVILDRSIK